MDFLIVYRNLPFIAEATYKTLIHTVIAFAFALAIAFIVGTLRSFNLKSLPRLFLSFYVEFFRGSPLLIQLFFIYYGLPKFNIVLDSSTAAIIGLALNGGAYMSEIIRAAILSVDKGQYEASYTLGYTGLQKTWHIILPQAIRIAVPSIVNGFSGILKGSSLISVLSITELTRAGQLIYTRTSKPFEIYLVIALLYFLMTYIVSLLALNIESKLSAKYN
ncbi:MAG TPA: amino acid ABC transporter permease [Clostridia bacterium]|nr:amino acid ABC transporter permease [Clostridia bacterium]